MLTNLKKPFFSDLSLTFEADSGHKRFLEDAFENESRVPAGNYGPASVHYTDVVSIVNCSSCSFSILKALKYLKH